MQTEQVRNIILVGFMGSGKSSVGRALSRRCGWPRVDADDMIVARAGKSIADIFRDSGEDAFRELERTVMKDICEESGRVISGGGGSFVDDENRRIMLDCGTVFYLNASPETLHRRVTGRNTNTPVRPLLAGGDPLERIQELLAQRAPAYAEAHHIIETDELSPAQVAEAILKICGPGLSGLSKNS
ncbi:MAG: shikimate kinase [Chloroflexi bacterium]|nr:shikimate kinase [Chloroflexota bacterium]